MDSEFPARNTMSPSLDANSVSSSTSHSETENTEDISVIKKVVESFDAWDPSCDLPVISSTILTRSENQKKEKKEKEKQTADTTSQVTEDKPDEEDKGPKKPQFEAIEDNMYLCER